MGAGRLMDTGMIAGVMEWEIKRKWVLENNRRGWNRRVWRESWDIDNTNYWAVRIDCVPARGKMEGERIRLIYRYQRKVWWWELWW